MDTLILISVILAMFLVACFWEVRGRGGSSAHRDEQPYGTDEYRNDEDSGGDGEA